MTRTVATLVQREWLQHRFAWALMAIVPLGLAFLFVSVGRIEFDGADATPPGQLALMLAAVPAAAGMALLLAIAAIAGLFTVAVLARRDHGDRSVQFWLSLPVPHSAALGVPLVVHMVVVPAAAMLVGWLGGQALGALLVGRIAGLAALAEVPWTVLLPATATMTLRFLAGLPLAVLWVLPLVLLLTLMYAWFRRWGWVILVAGIGLQGLLDELSFGQRWLLSTAGDLLRHAGLALAGASKAGLSFQDGDEAAAVVQAMQALPAMALRDFGAALADLASPLFVGGLLFSAGCFALLLRWRQREAGASS
ncbi:MAG: hypothetical protein KIT17_12390 [Rubrivivax sp.]|nr:hypothetical protein [Rubrivivax sp.]